MSNRGPKPGLGNVPNRDRIVRTGPAVVEVDANGVIVAWSAGARQMFPRAGRDVVGHPVEALPCVSGDEARALLADVLAGGVVSDHPIGRVSTRRFPIRLNAFPAYDPVGEVRGAIGILHEVSGDSRVPVPDGRDVRRLAALVASSSDAALTEDLGGRITSWDGGAEDLFGYAAADVIGRPSGIFLPPDLAGEDALIRGRVLSGEAVVGYETRRCALDGSVRDVSVTMTPVRSATGQIVELATIARDIGRRKRAERDLVRYARDLEALARRDSLTGLLTPRELHGVLDAELGRAARGGGRCSLLMIGVDRLAAVNERLGRSAGDDLLRELAEVVESCTDETVAVCRAGGDEIAAVVPDAAAGPAMALAARIQATWSARDPHAEVTIGIATYPDEADSKQALITSARSMLRWSSAGERVEAPASGDPCRGGLLGDTEDRLVALLRRHLGMQIAYLSEFVDGSQIVRIVDAGPEHPDIRRGAVVPLDRGFCLRMVNAEIPHVIPDTSLDPTTAGLAAARDARIGSYVGVPVRYSDGRIYGSLCCASGTASHHLNERATYFAHVCARLIGDLLDQRALEEENRRLHDQLTGVRALLAALDARDNYTGEHSEAVVRLAGAVARRLSLTPTHIAAVEQVAVLHDIGKIGIPDSVLHKPGRLDDAEWEVMREHPEIGARIVGSIPSLVHLAPAVRAEHERWDGLGYPDGLAAEGIPLASRIILACDAYHAMTSDRPYRKAMTRAAAERELRDGAGSQFDPAVVRALLAELRGASSRVCGPRSASTA